MATRLTPGSPPLLRRLNSALVLDTIRANGPIARADIARATGLSKPTVNEVVELLLSDGYVQERVAEGELRPRRPGPRARLLSFRADLGHVLGLDIGANKILALVADLSGRVVASERRRTGGRDALGADTLLREVRATVRAALSGAGVPADELKAVGVGTPGVVDPGSGRVTLAPQLAGWEGIQLGSRLGGAFSCPVLVDNEVHLSLLAERWHGAAQNVQNAVHVQLGVGIGGGILIGGELYRGATGSAGEIGYLPLGDASGSGGAFGPFEHAAGGRAFARLGAEAAQGPEGALLRELAGGDPLAVDAEVVFAAAARYDPAASAIVEELCRRIAGGIAAVTVVLDPECVIVGGGLSRAGNVLLEPLQRHVQSLVPLPPPLVLSKLGDEAVALGAVRLAIQAVDERLFAFTTEAVAAAGR